MSGDPANALQVLRDHERLLREELGVEPPAELHALAEQLIEGRGTRGILQSDDDQRPPQQEAVERGPTLTPHIATRPLLTGRPLLTSFVVALAVLGAVATGWFLLTGPAREAEERMSIAVLPFENRSPNSDDAYFAEGIHDEIIGQLAKIADLKVISRTSVMEYKDRAENLRTIAGELQVTHILEGSVRRAGDRVRITAQLIAAENDKNLWVESYERKLTDVFAIQSDVAQQIATALQARLSREEERRIDREPTKNLEAYDFYLRGNSYSNRGFDEEFVRIAIQMYQNAVELDPKFAIAWARLCGTHALMYWLYYDHTGERLARAREAIDKALEIDPDLPEVHLALAWYFYHGYLDYERALSQVEMVQRIEPNNSEAWALIHYIQRRQGKFEQATANIERALELDPRNGFVHDQASQTYRLMRDYPAAKHHMERAILLEPSSATGYMDGVRLYLQWFGSTDRARDFLGQARRAGAADNEFLKYYSVIVDIFDRRYEAALDQLMSEPLPAYSIYPSFVPRAQLIAQVHGLLENPELERAFYDSSRSTVEANLREVPDDDRLYSALGIAFAGVGRKDDAVLAGRKAVELMPVETEAWRGAVRLEDLARIRAMVGDDEAAADQLEYLLSIPSAVSAALLRVDPTWTPLRGHPRFQALLEKYE